LTVSDQKLKWVFLIPSVIALMFLTLYPFLQAVWMSFHNWPLAGDAPQFVGAGNYAALVSSGRFHNALWNTVVFTGVSVTVEMVLGTVIALYLHSLSKRWRPIFRTAFVIPMMITPIVTGLMWRLMLDNSIGVINYLIYIAGFTPPEWTSSPLMAMITVILIDIWQWTPLVVLIVFAGLLSIPKSYYEAARVDGAPRWAIFRHITLPGIKYMLAIAAVFRLMRSFRSFDIIWLVTRGGPGTATEILNIFLYRVAFVNLSGGRAAALGIILLVMTIGTTMGLLRIVGVQ
jgi:multiple sugar transport system permease protein